MKTERIIIYVVIIVSLVLSVIANCRSLPRTVGLDYIGVIVGVLTLLVALLVGWNIYTVVDFDKKTNSMEIKIRSVIERMNKEMKHTVRAYTLFLSAGNGYSMGNTEIAINNYISAIEESIKGNEREPINLSLHELSDMCAYYSSRNIVPRIKKEEKARYISTLYRLNHDEYHSYDIDKIIAMIDSAG